MSLRQLQTMAAAAACLGMIASPVAMAAPQAQTSFAADVALGGGGVLVGQLVDAQGKVMTGTPVSIQTGGQEVARVATNENGVFFAQGLAGGVYEVAAAEHRGVYRLWAPTTAPPQASQSITAVSQPTVAPVQYGAPVVPPLMEPPLIGPPPAPVMATGPAKKGPLGKTMSWVSEHPLLTAGIVATAIAVPVALSDDDDPAS